DQAELASFLLRAFDDPGLSGASILSWKYFRPRPDWQGSRSFAVRQGGVIVGHLRAQPVTLLTDAGEVTSIHCMDWAADRSSPGAGVIVLRKLMSMADTFVVPGGSKDTREIIPKLGFRIHGSRDTFVR